MRTREQTAVVNLKATRKRGGHARDRLLSLNRKEDSVYLIGRRVAGTGRRLIRGQNLKREQRCRHEHDGGDKSGDKFSVGCSEFRTNPMTPAHRLLP
jgi:hypothetical protein